MKTRPIEPAVIEFVDGRAPRAPAFGDVYHAEGGAAAQARHVFLNGNGLPARWQGRERFVVVETGFGLGNNFLATWQAWRDDPQRSRRLDYVALDRHPPHRADLERAHAGSPWPELAQALVAIWPPPTPNLHLLEFEAGAVRLLLGFGEVADLVRELQLAADAFFLDGFAPARNPAMWDPRVLRALARLAAPGATAATWSSARVLRDALSSAGFEVRRVPGFDRKRDMSCARYAPAFVPRRAPARLPAHAPGDGRAREALVLGAGLAGASAAEALARAGWSVTVLERRAEPAGEASGNPAGLFHGTAHASDGVHARFTRAAALLAARRHAHAIARGNVAGACDGLLQRRDGSPPMPLPEGYLQRWSADHASAQAGVPLDGESWFFPQAGWIAPAALTRWLLAQPGITLRCGADVTSLEARDGRWHALDAAGQALGAAPVVVLATGVAPAPAGTGADALPLASVRGQVTWFASERRPRLPLAGHGYALALPDGRVLCGASTGEGDTDPAVRAADHAFNLARLGALCGLAPEPSVAPGGRTGWRAQAPDRLPVVGAMPCAWDTLPEGLRLDQARLVPRIPGLYVLGGLASRGLTWAPLAAEVLAAWIEGAPFPLEADLVDAIDPARWLVRRVRRSGS